MTISSQDILQQYRSGNPYLLFDGLASDATPREFIPLIDTIRKESEWRNAGLPIRKDRNGNYKSIVRSGLYFGFTPLLDANEVKLLAIQTAKKCTQDPAGVYSLIRQGSSYDDFVLLSSDVLSYCKAMSSVSTGSDAEALHLIQKAFQEKPQEPLYATLFFDLRLKLKDNASIDEELRHFENDIDSLVHNGRIYELLKYLVAQKNKPGAFQLIQDVNQMLDELIAGKRQNRIYGTQKSEWYLHKKEQFNKKIEKIKSQIRVVAISSNHP